MLISSLYHRTTHETNTHEKKKHTHNIQQAVNFKYSCFCAHSRLNGCRDRARARSRRLHGTTFTCDYLLQNVCKLKSENVFYYCSRRSHTHTHTHTRRPLFVRRSVVRYIAHRHHRRTQRVKRRETRAKYVFSIAGHMWLMSVFDHQNHILTNLTISSIVKRK